MCLPDWHGVRRRRSGPFSPWEKVRMRANVELRLLARNASSIVPWQDESLLQLALIPAFSRWEKEVGARRVDAV